MTAAKHMRYGLTGTGDTFVVRGPIKHPKGSPQIKYTPYEDHNPREIEFESAEEAINYAIKHNKYHYRVPTKQKRHARHKALPRELKKQLGLLRKKGHSYYISPVRDGTWDVSFVRRKNSVARVDPKGKVHELEWLGLRTGGEWDNE